MIYKYLTDHDVIAINFMVIRKYTPSEPIQLKDSGLLNSATNRPKQSVFGEDAYVGVFSKAAALFESLAKNHVFVNANKRTAWVATTVFLRKNGYTYRNANQQEIEDFVVDFVNGKYKLVDVEEFLKRNSEKTLVSTAFLKACLKIRQTANR